MNYLFGIDGRISRGKWWLAQFLIAGLYIVVLAILRNKTGQMPENFYDLIVLTSDIPQAAVPLLFALWINFSVSAKRFHDRDKSGLWVLIFFVPLIGTVWQIVECGGLAGTPGTNRFGPEPENTPKPSRDRTQGVSAERFQQASGNRVRHASASSTQTSFLGRNQVDSSKPMFGRRGA